MAEQNPGQQNQQQPNQQQIQLKVSDEILKGVYANIAQVAHNREEFQLNFINLDLTGPLGTVVSKILISPGHMKRLVAALQDNVKRYEQQFGAIEAAEAPAGADKIGFRV